MRIARLSMRNWQPFRGEHELLLDARAYAVVARQAGDRDRSNWAGKTSLLEAVEFALYGVHRHRREDEFISHGEKSAEVTIEFDDGLRVTRSRQFGKPTRFYLFDKTGTAYKDDAEVVLRSRIGLSHEDFRATSYFPQKAMQRLVSMEPSDRMALVSSWFRLEPLQRAAKKHGGEIAGLVREVTRLQNQRAVARATFDNALASVNSKTVDEMRGDLVDCEEEIEIVSGHLAAAQDARAKNEALLAGRENVERYDALMADGKKLAAECAEFDAGVAGRQYKLVDEQKDAAVTAAHQARIAYQAKQVLARGQFDGVCPVAGIACPARDEINARATENARQFDEAKRRLEAALSDQEQAVALHGAASARMQEQDRRLARLQAMREQERSLRDSVEAAREGKVTPRETLNEEVGRLSDALVRLKAEKKMIENAIELAERSVRDDARIEAELAEVGARLTTHREAFALFGPNGAQRKIAEDALAEIEAGANALLGDCGIPLTLRVQWAREGSQIASACSACGAPFPASARVKACEHCGEARGKNVVNKLEVLLSNRSGAAEDLVGGALQLAASAWLRQDRHSGWGVAMLDEPFSALDRSLRKSFATHLVTMLGRTAFEQAFVISHTADTVDMLPGRIEVISDGTWATARVA